MTGEEMVALCKKHTIFEWSAQDAVDPIPVARAQGVYFWTPEGKRYIDFNSQLMCVNIGNGAARTAWRKAGHAHARRYRGLLLHQRRR
jgi:taurine--2-oxoglutarate transaminase